jgi:hypothetical protein
VFDYANKRGSDYVRVGFEGDLDPADVDFSEDGVLVAQELARQLKEAAPTVEAPVPAPGPAPPIGAAPLLPGSQTPVEQPPLFTGKTLASIKWKSPTPPQ